MMSSFAGSTGSNASISATRVYIITANSRSVSSMQTITVFMNTVVPISTLTPVSQTIICRGVNPVAANSSPLQNIIHHFIPPGGGVPFTTTLNPAFYTPPSAGVYTHVIVDNTNGCSSSYTFAVFVAPSPFPTFTLANPQNFTVGCNSKSVATVASLANNPGGAFSYTVLAPGGSTILDFILFI